MTAIACRDADVLAAALSVGSLDLADESALQEHLRGCPDCRRTAAEYMAAAARLPVALDPVQPTPELRTRLMKAVYAEAALEAQREAAAPARLMAWWRRAWTMIPSGRGFTVLAGAAAIAVVAVTSWSLASRQTAAPSSVAVAVTARPVAPAVHGWLTYDRAGGQAMLAVTGLPGAGQVTGRDGVYEVWFIRPDGSTQPAGYLSQSPDGTWTAALRGDMSGYSAVAATAEPLGGSRSPTGPEVLQAPLS